jgi:hypothetical protein
MWQARLYQRCASKRPFQEPYYSAIAARDRYDNHLAVRDNIDAIEAKFAKEEEKSFHIHITCFLSYLIVGRMINPIQSAWQKGKGRICIYCTHGPDGTDTPGSPNTLIPKPSAENPSKCLPAFYMTAFACFLCNIWRLWITFPSLGILFHADDINAAFWRILYHPEMASVFAYVFSIYLIIPVGQCFGSCSAPRFSV